MEREGEKNYKCCCSPTSAAQFFGLRRAGEVEFVIIASKGGRLVCVCVCVGWEGDNKETLLN